MSRKLRLPRARTLAVLALGTAMACSSVPPAGRSPAGSTTSAVTVPSSSSSSYWAWESSTREACDTLLGEADQLRADGRPSEAMDCLVDALARVLAPPPGYRPRMVYLDYVADILDQLDAVEAELDGSDASVAGAEDELMDLIASEVAEEKDTTEESAEPEVAGLASDFPVVVNDTVASLLQTLVEGGEIRRRVEVGLSRAGRYLPMIREQLRAAALPEDLAYLPLIESAFSPSAYSHARAAGLWQFIASTARIYGLHVGALVDERRDPERATTAAVAHLADLYNEFGDWYLALAAYNSGSGNVRRAMRRSGSTDFWAMRRYLPRETRSYVPAFIAALIVAKNPEKYGFTPTVEKPWAYDHLAVPDALDLDVLADRLDVAAADLRSLNPALTHGLTPADTTTRVRLPIGLADSAKAVLAELPRNDWAPRFLHTVRRGDTLSGIASRYRSSIAAIRQANGIRGSLIHPGQQLVVPRGAGGAVLERPVRRASNDGHYTVRARDTLWDISRSLGVSVKALCAANGIGAHTVIRPGQRLKVPSGSRQVRSASSSGHTYRVRAGDTLYDIARRFGTSVRSLRRANGLRGSRIHPGDLLRIPSSEAKG